MDWRARSMHRPVFNEPGHAHELTFTCFHRYRFFQAESTCQWLADAIADARLALEFALWAYVFMPEHIHLLIYPKRAPHDLRIILQEIKEPVGRKAVQYLRDHAPEWLPRITVKRGQRVDAPLLASGRRLRSQRLRATDGAGDDRIHPRQSSASRVGRQGRTVEMVQRRLVRGQELTEA